MSLPSPGSPSGCPALMAPGPGVREALIDACFTMSASLYDIHCKGLLRPWDVPFLLSRSEDDEVELLYFSRKIHRVGHDT